MDWSDKKEAHEIDTACFNLRNGHTNKQFHPGAARYQEIQSTPESWAQVEAISILQRGINLSIIICLAIIIMPLVIDLYQLVYP